MAHPRKTTRNVVCAADTTTHNLAVFIAPNPLLQTFRTDLGNISYNQKRKLLPIKMFKNEPYSSSN